MLLQSNKSNNGIAEMLISTDADNIDFTVTFNTLQFDFTIDENDWQLLKEFIDKSIELQK